MRQQRVQLMTIIRGSVKACLGLTTGSRRLSYGRLGGRVGGLVWDAAPLLWRRGPISNIRAIPSLPGGRRLYSTGSSFIPRGLIFRAFWTGVTATIGYLYYQISQATGWLQEQLDMLQIFGAESLGSALNLFEILSRWRPSIKRKDGGGSQQQRDVPGVVEDAGGSVNPMVEAHGDDRFRDFIRKMIEARNILRQAEIDEPTGSHEGVMLPSIVVIGSQSSGKSSVLESIVGHEFLPKGNNMVTRRPLELTLVNSTTAGRDYAIFPGPGEDPTPIYDFAQVRRRLEQLNASVPADDWISPHPIELTIYSRHVPDLSLVDLPGYIQVTSKSQPSILRDRIARLCERYIQQNNIILAICAADVDLANAEALKAARAVDPTGQRTIGVLTKLDLVDAQYATQIILNDDYPLRLGYVGVICRSPETKSGSLTGGSFAFLSSSSSSTALVSTDPGRYEDRYIREHERVFEPVKHQLGIGCLRQKLTLALESSMAHSLSGVLTRVNNELAEVRYALKVEYNDRSISPEAYVAFLAGSVKGGLERVARDYNKTKVRSIVRALLEERLLAVIEETLWMTMSSENPGSSTPHVADARLEMAVDQLTRSGIGRMVANGLVDAIIAQTKMIIREGPLAAHPAASERLISQVEGAMRERCHLAIEQIENAIKPLKHDGMDVDLAGEELGLGEGSATADRGDRWKVARTRLLTCLQSVEHRWDQQLRTLQAEVGPRRLRAIVKRLSGPVSAGGTVIGQDASAITSLSPTSRELVGKVQQIVQLSRQLKILRGRLTHLGSSECANLASLRDGVSPSFISSLISGWWWPTFGGRSSNSHNGDNSIASNSPIGPASSSSSPFSMLRRCPEIYLYVVMERLLGTASLHAHHELVYEFLHPFPERMTLASSSSSHSGGGGTQELLPMIQENPVIYRHWQLQERRKILERARDRLQFLQQYRSQSSPSSGAASAVSEFSSDAEK